ncbi:hypothetical protein ACLOJK_009902 [Asimina triloba]
MAINAAFGAFRSLSASLNSNLAFVPILCLIRKGERQADVPSRPSRCGRCRWTADKPSSHSHRNSLQTDPPGLSANTNVSSKSAPFIILESFSQPLKIKNSSLRQTPRIPRPICPDGPPGGNHKNPTVAPKATPSISLSHSPETPLRIFNTATQLSFPRFPSKAKAAERAENPKFRRNPCGKAPNPMTNRKPPTTGRTNLASCVVAAIFLVFVAIVILIVFFTLFNPKEPKIAVNAVQLPSFAVANGTITFTFSQYVSVRNPNRSVFTHYDSSLQLVYAGSQVGFMFIPAGKIQGGHTQYMSATFSVQSFPFSAAQPAAAAAGGVRLEPTMEIESKLRMEGRVRILHFFTHHVEAGARCRVAVSVADGSVVAFRC